MYTLSSTIREKPNWWEKINDPAFTEKWTREALDQQKWHAVYARPLRDRSVPSLPVVIVHWLAKRHALTSDDRCLQELGSVETTQGHCFGSLNFYEHQI